MRRQFALFTAAALTVSAFSLTASAQDDRTAAQKAGDATERAVERTGDAAQRAADRTKDAVGNIDVRSENNAALGAGKLPAGIQKTAKDDSEDIRDMLAYVTEASITNGGFDDLVERFVDADRNRIGQFLNDKNNDFATLNGRIDQIRKDWKAKYNQEFDLNENMVFGQEFKNFQIVQGEIVNPTLLSNWPVMNKSTPSGGGSTDLQKKDDGVSARIGDTRVKADVDVNISNDKLAGGNKNLDKGRNVAVLTFPASHGLPELNASLIHELPDSWKIDVPDTVTGQQLHDQLLNHLTKFGEMKAQWPADVNDAYRAASHHVLMAVYGVSAQQGAQNPSSK